jgi:hypothetical protein
MALMHHGGRSSYDMVKNGKHLRDIRLSQLSAQPHPALNGAMIYSIASLRHQLLQVAIAERISNVPAYALQYNLLLVVTAFETGHNFIQILKFWAQEYSLASQQCRFCDRTVGKRYDCLEETCYSKAHVIVVR